jgi:hypothetical protein
MTVYLACGAAVLLGIIFLGVKNINASREDAWKQQALDDRNALEMMEERLALGLEHDLFDKAV